MNRNLSDLLAHVGVIKSEYKEICDQFAYDASHLNTHFEEITRYAERVEEDIDDLESCLSLEKTRRAEAESFLQEYEEEEEQNIIFRSESLEDRGKIEVLERLYKGYTWNELSEIENQLNSKNK